MYELLFTSCWYTIDDHFVFFIITVKSINMCWINKYANCMILIFIIIAAVAVHDFRALVSNINIIFCFLGVFRAESPSEQKKKSIALCAQLFIVRAFWVLLFLVCAIKSGSTIAEMS